MMEHEGLTECPMCATTYANPKKLECDHTLCEHCVARITANDMATCPICHVASSAFKIKNDFRLQQFLDALAKQADTLTGLTGIQAAPSKNEGCELCLTPNSGFWCEECRQWMCETCKYIHRNAKSSQDHTVGQPLYHLKADLNRNLKKKCEAIDIKIHIFRKALKSHQKDLSRQKKDKLESMEAKHELNLCYGMDPDEMEQLSTVHDDMIRIRDVNIALGNNTIEKLKKTIADMDSSVTDAYTLIKGDQCFRPQDNRVLQQLDKVLNRLSDHNDLEELTHSSPPINKESRWWLVSSAEDTKEYLSIICACLAPVVLCCIYLAFFM